MPSAASRHTRGIWVSLGSSVSFGVIYFLTPMLAPMSGEAIWAVRTLVTLPFLVVVLLALRRWELVVEIGQRIRRRPWLLAGIVASGLLLAAQLWIFSWAPMNGRALQVALGYFLLPLVLVVVGRFVYGDRMTWWQWLAAGVAAVGVGYEIVRVGGMSWETLVVALGYPVYFVLRRAMGTSHLGGMWWEMAVLFPVAAVVTVMQFSSGSLLAENPALWWAAPSISLFAAAALLLYLLASRLLSMSVFGLLSYVEPALLLVASLLLGERIAPGEWFTYGAIWAAVGVLVAGGVFALLRARREPGEPPPTTQPIPVV